VRWRKYVVCAAAAGLAGVKSLGMRQLPVVTEQMIYIQKRRFDRSITCIESPERLQSELRRSARISVACSTVVETEMQCADLSLRLRGGIKASKSSEYNYIAIVLKHAFT